MSARQAAKMYLKFSSLLLPFFALIVHGVDVKDKRQVGSIVTQKSDHEVAESGFGGPSAVHAGSKYFQDIYMAQHSPEQIEFGYVCETPKDWEQRFEKINFEDKSHRGKVLTDSYAHVPAKDHYEHGHKRGNEHHFIERHEKAHPHAGEFKTKVRWGDKHGGYGEHYWDYNHAGHGHDGDGEESKQNEEYTAYEESKNVPKYAENARGKREPHIGGDVEFINDKARSLVLGGITGKHGGNYKAEKDFERGKREHKKVNAKELVYDPSAGIIVDQKTGKAYELKPVDY